MIKNQSTISKDDREILSNIDLTYEEWGATQQSKKGVRKLIEPVWLDSNEPAPKPVNLGALGAGVARVWAFENTSVIFAFWSRACMVTSRLLFGLITHHFQYKPPICP